MNPKARFYEFCRQPQVQKYLGTASFVGKVEGAPIPFLPVSFRKVRPPRPVYEKNMLFLGDAACMVHPFTGEGISLALYSGKLAAECLVQQGLQGPRLGEQYQRALITFAEQTYALWKTALLFYLPCLLPKLARKIYLSVLPLLVAIRDVWANIRHRFL